MTPAAAGGTYVTPTAGDTYVTSAAAAALHICVTPTAEALGLFPLHLETPR